MNCQWLWGDARGSSYFKVVYYVATCIRNVISDSKIIDERNIDGEFMVSWLWFACNPSIVLFFSEYFSVKMTLIG